MIICVALALGLRDTLRMREIFGKLELIPNMTLMAQTSFAPKCMPFTVHERFDVG
jgi:hypothetical protein